MRNVVQPVTTPNYAQIIMDALGAGMQVYKFGQQYKADKDAEEAKKLQALALQPRQQIYQNEQGQDVTGEGKPAPKQPSISSDEAKQKLRALDPGKYAETMQLKGVEQQDINKERWNMSFNLQGKTPQEQGKIITDKINELSDKGYQPEQLKPFHNLYAYINSGDQNQITQAQGFIKSAVEEGIQAGVLKGGQGITYEFGKIPESYALAKGPSGEPLGMSKIKGAPQSDKEMKERLKRIEEENKKKSSEQTKAKAANIVIEDAERLKKLIKDAPFYNPVVGTTASIFGKIETSNRANAEQLKNSIVSNIGFDRLQQMRNDSPTGGALGQVSDTENRLLQAALGSIDLSQSEDQLIRNINRVIEIYKPIAAKAAAYPNAKKYGFTNANYKQTTGQEMPQDMINRYY